MATKDCAPRVSTSACAGETGPRMATPGAVAMVMLLVWFLVLLGPRWFQLRAGQESAGGDESEGAAAA